MDEKQIIPEHQFGFLEKHATIKQVYIYRLVNKINKDLNTKIYCSDAFLDTSQAFDKVWHKGLQYKLKRCLAHRYYQILNFYLYDRYLVKQGQ